jgi:hypothetical protein
LRNLPPGLGLAIVSAATAAAILIVTRATSNQAAIVAIKRQIQADLFEMRLFNDDLRAMARAQADMLRHNAVYLRLSLVPLLWLAVPLIVVLAQLQSYFGYVGPAAGCPVILTAQLTAPREPDARLEPVSGLRSETPPVWLPGSQQLVWRVVAEAAGEYILRFVVDGHRYEKSLHVSDDVARRSPVRPGALVMDQVEFPSEPPVDPSGPVKTIAVSYGEREFAVFGWRMPWMVLFFAETFLFALVLRRPLGVTL